MPNHIKVLIATILSVERHTYYVSLSHLAGEIRIEEYQEPKPQPLQEVELSRLLPLDIISPPQSVHVEGRADPPTRQRKNDLLSQTQKHQFNRYKLFQRKY